MIKLGDKVKDKLTGFNGTVVARAEYLFGCVWVCVVPEKLHDDKPIEDVWFDEQRLDVIPKKNKPEKKLPEPVESDYHGGPMLSIPKRSVPHPNSHD